MAELSSSRSPNTTCKPWKGRSCGEPGPVEISLLRRWLESLVCVGVGCESHGRRPFERDNRAECRVCPNHDRPPLPIQPSLSPRPSFRPTLSTIGPRQVRPRRPLEVPLLLLPRREPPPFCVAWRARASTRLASRRTSPRSTASSTRPVRAPSTTNERRPRTTSWASRLRDCSRGCVLSKP